MSYTVYVVAFETPESCGGHDWFHASYEADRAYKETLESGDYETVVQFTAEVPETLLDQAITDLIDDHCWHHLLTPLHGTTVDLSVREHYGNLDLSFSNVGGIENAPEEARAFLHGFLDFFGTGEAGSFTVEDDRDEHGDSWPLTRGTGKPVQWYRYGWLTAERFPAKVKETV